MFLYNYTESYISFKIYRFEVNHAIKKLEQARKLFRYIIADKPRLQSSIKIV